MLLFIMTELIINARFFVEDLNTYKKVILYLKINTCKYIYNLYKIIHYGLNIPLNFIIILVYFVKTLKKVMLYKYVD